MTPGAAPPPRRPPHPRRRPPPSAFPPRRRPPRRRPRRRTCPAATPAAPTAPSSASSSPSKSAAPASRRPRRRRPYPRRHHPSPRPGSDVAHASRSDGSITEDDPRLARLPALRPAVILAPTHSHRNRISPRPNTSRSSPMSAAKARLWPKPGGQALLERRRLRDLAAAPSHALQTLAPEQHRYPGGSALPLRQAHRRQVRPRPRPPRLRCRVGDIIYTPRASPMVARASNFILTPPRLQHLQSRRHLRRLPHRHRPRTNLTAGPRRHPRRHLPRHPPRLSREPQQPHRQHAPRPRNRPPSRRPPARRAPPPRRRAYARIRRPPRLRPRHRPRRRRRQHRHDPYLQQDLRPRRRPRAGADAPPPPSSTCSTASARPSTSTSAPRPPPSPPSTNPPDRNLSATHNTKWRTWLTATLDRRRHQRLAQRGQLHPRSISALVRPPTPPTPG